jgi:predicted Zn finger-like uncharacterized protein
MRITCPNCGAQYEVDDALIPEAGRDVQCSNCGKGWFQARHPEAGQSDETVEDVGDAGSGHAPEPSHDAASDEVAEHVSEEIAEEETVAAEAQVEEAPEAGLHDDEDERAAEPDEEPAAGHHEEDEEEEEAREEPPAASVAEPTNPPLPDETDEDEEPAPATVAAPPRKTDETVLAVLREEAEREIAERRKEAEALETQPDLGLAEPAERSPSRATAEGAAIAAGARRDLLPDIDEINSTLRSDADRPGTADEDSGEDLVTERRRGFRLGFGLMILLAAVLIGLYVGAGWLAATFPALEPFLIAYVGWANGLSDWLDGLLAAGVDGMSALIAPGPDAS